MAILACAHEHYIKLWLDGGRNRQTIRQAYKYGIYRRGGIIGFSPILFRTLLQFLPELFGSFPNCLYLCHRLPLARMGLGSLHCGYRTFTNVIFDCRISHIQVQKRRNRNVRVWVYYSRVLRPLYGWGWFIICCGVG